MRHWRVRDNQVHVQHEDQSGRGDGLANTWSFNIECHISYQLSRLRQRAYKWTPDLSVPRGLVQWWGSSRSLCESLSLVPRLLERPSRTARVTEEIASRHHPHERGSDIVSLTELQNFVHHFASATSYYLITCTLCSIETSTSYSLLPLTQSEHLEVTMANGTA